jgi:hypothetical protein
LFKEARIQSECNRCCEMMSSSSRRMDAVLSSSYAVGSTCPLLSLRADALQRLPSVRSVTRTNLIHTVGRKTRGTNERDAEGLRG